MNSIGVVVDVNAPKHLLYSFMEKFVPDTQPVIVVTSGAGSNERKLKLAVELLEKCSPAAVCGCCPDLVAIAEMFLEKNTLATDDQDVDEEFKKNGSKAAPLLRTNKLHKSRSPSPCRKQRDIHKVPLIGIIYHAHINYTERSGKASDSHTTFVDER